MLVYLRLLIGQGQFCCTGLPLKTRRGAGSPVQATAFMSGATPVARSSSLDYTDFV